MSGRRAHRAARTSRRHRIEFQPILRLVGGRSPALLARSAGARPLGSTAERAEVMLEDAPAAIGEETAIDLVCVRTRADRRTRATGDPTCRSTSTARR